MEKFKFKKQYGQNFISDKNLLKAISCDANLSKNDVVLEIGPGKGTLTSCLAEVCKKVVAVEIDTTLQPFLKENLSMYDNVEVVFGDIMQMSKKDILGMVGNKYKIVANLPYYITTPILFKFLEDGAEVDSITVMVQKEVAERMCATNKDSNYGILSVMCNFYAKCEIKRIVDRKMFYPVPNVDSAIVKLDLYHNQNLDFSRKMYKVVQGCFAMKRKTLANNLMHSFGMDRSRAESLIEKLGFIKTVRAEELAVEHFEKLVNLI